jgi:hypothetical protein
LGINHWAPLSGCVQPMVAARFGANGRDGNSHKIGLKPEYG